MSSDSFLPTKKLRLNSCLRVSRWLHFVSSEGRQWSPQHTHTHTLQAGDTCSVLTLCSSPRTDVLRPTAAQSPVFSVCAANMLSMTMNSVSTAATSVATNTQPVSTFRRHLPPPSSQPSIDRYDTELTSARCTHTHTQTHTAACIGNELPLCPEQFSESHDDRIFWTETVYSVKCLSNFWAQSDVFKLFLYSN